MKAWTYIIAATVCVALSVTFLTSPAPSTAQEGGRSPTLATLADSQAVTNAEVSPASVADAVADIAMFVSKDGKLELAGVISVEINDVGIATVVLKRGGSFDRDAVLTLNVPIIQLPTGQLAADGFNRITFRKETVVLTIQQDVDNRQQNIIIDPDNSDPCRLLATLPTMEVHCSSGSNCTTAEKCKFVTLNNNPIGQPGQPSFQQQDLDCDCLRNPL